MATSGLAGAALAGAAFAGAACDFGVDLGPVALTTYPVASCSGRLGMAADTSRKGSRSSEESDIST